MSDSGNDKQQTTSSQPTDGRGLCPARFAEQVTSLVGDGEGIRGGELPMWERIAKPPRLNTWWLRLLRVLAWYVAISLLAAAALRLFCHDATVPLVWLNAFTLYIYLPAYLTLLFAVPTRRWRLAAVSAAVVVCHLIWVLPDFRPATPYVPPVGVRADEVPAIKIFYVNVRGSNMKMDEVLAEAQRNDPDVIVLAEMQRYWWHQMIERNPLKAYPYGTDLQHRNAGDIGVFSRLPVSRMEQIHVESRTVLSLDISLGTESLRLFALHSPRPMLRMTDDYFKFWQTIAPILTQQHGSEVVIGDFNATQHSLIYQQLKADGFRSAHEDRGRGYLTSWPNSTLPVPPIRIDQAFLSPEVECISIEEGEGPGSDHKPLILILRAHESAPTDRAR